MESLFVIASAATLVVAAALAVWRAQREAEAREAEARLRAAAEERARQEAEAREAEARLRAAAEEKARQEAEAREAEARLRAAAEEKARKEAARAQRESERAQRESERARQEAARAQREAERARNAERRAARLGDDLAEARTEIARTVPERDLVNALRKAIPAMDPERAKRLENQLESLARNRSSEARLLEDLKAAADEAARAEIRRKLDKAHGDAEAIVARLRNVLENEPSLQAVRLSLAWGTRVSTSSSKSKTDKKTE